MIDMEGLANALFGGKRAEVQEVSTDGTTRTYMGVAVSDSADGMVRVDLGGDVTLPDDLYDEEGNPVAEWDGEGIEIPTSPQVFAGQDVLVTLVGGGALKTPMVTACAGTGDSQDSSITEAADLAQDAWDYADDAKAAADAAQESAETAATAAASAQDSADDAYAAAQQAIGDAAAASTAASSAQSSAESAASAAQTANENAQQAIEDAAAASDAATAAQGSANQAQISANAAQASATSANAHAVAALNSLSTVEDVVDTLTWITEHGTMAKTTDTAVDPTKVYFVRDNSGSYVVGSYSYSIVQEPVTSGLPDYYELNIDKSVQNYISTHLSLTNEGLWLTPTESNAYRVLVAIGGSGKTYTNAGTYIIDGSGVTVAQFTGTRIGFAQNRQFYIGDSSAFIFFDGQGHINIGGTGVTIGGSTTLAELLAKYDATITSDDISVSKTGGTATITIGGESVTISDGAQGAAGGRWYAGTGITGTSTTATTFSGSGVSDAVVGDMYLNTSTYNTYRCTVAGAPSVAKWVYTTANIKGETGPQGPQGETGGTGAQGVSITGVEHQYYLSTSSSTQTGGSWSVTPAAYVEGRYYWERWKITFSNSTTTYTTATLAEEVTSAWTAIEQNDEQIALKANATDVYTKTAVDGKIAQEVTDRNSAITAKANEINLSVTEKVYQGAQPNLSPFFLMAPTDVYNATTNPDGYWGVDVTSLATLEQLADGWWHINFSNTATSNRWFTIYEHCAWRHKAGDLKGSTKYTVMLEFRNVTKTGSVTCIGTTQHATSWPSMFIGNSEQGNVGVADGVQYHVGTTVADPASVTGSSCTTRTLITFPAGSSLDAEFRVSLYEGEYAGPYKPYSGDMMYATNSELKVTADGISTEVSKKVNGTEIISTINQSAESITIDASKINLVGAVTIGDLASATQDAVLNSNVQVGGRNLVWDSDWKNTANKWDVWGSPTTREVVVLDGKRWLHLVTTAKWQGYQQRPSYRAGYGEIEPSATYTLSFLAYAASAGTTCVVGFHWLKSDGSIYAQSWDSVSLTTTAQRFVQTYSFGATSPVVGFNIMVGDNTDTARELWISEVKLERGNKATDWTPAPEDVDADISEVAINVEAASESAGDAMTQALAASGDAATALEAAEEAQSRADLAYSSADEIAASLSQLDESIQQWATFTSETGLTLGANDSDFDLNITNTRAAFRYQGTVTAYSSGTEYVAPRMTSDEFHVGGFMWTTHGSNGGMALKWVGLE